MKKWGIGAAIAAVALPGLWFSQAEKGSAPSVSNGPELKSGASPTLPAPGFASMEDVLDPNHAPVPVVPMAAQLVEQAAPTQQSAKRHVTKKRAVKGSARKGKVERKALEPAPYISATLSPVPEPPAEPTAIEPLEVVLMVSEPAEVSHDEAALADEPFDFVTPCLDEVAPAETGLASHVPVELPYPLFGSVEPVEQ